MTMQFPPPDPQQRYVPPAATPKRRRGLWLLVGAGALVIVVAIAGVVAWQAGVFDRYTQPGYSPEDPAAIGETIEVRTFDDVWEVTFGEPTFAADEEVLAADEYLDEAPVGLDYAVVQITVTYHPDEEGDTAIAFSSLLMSMLVEGESYTSVVAEPVIGDVEWHDVEISDGETVTADAVFAVPRNIDDYPGAVWQIRVLSGDDRYVAIR